MAEQQAVIGRKGKKPGAKPGVPRAPRIDIAGAQTGRTREELQSWPSTHMAAQQTGLGKSHLTRMAQTKQVEAVLVDGVWRFNPDDLAAAAEQSEEDAARQRVHKLLEQAQAHIQVLTRQMTEPVDRMLKLMLSENAALRERINTLEQRHLDMLEAYEKSVSLEHERALERELETRKAKRIDESLEQFWNYVPRLGSQLIGRRKVQQIIDDLSDDQLEILVQMEIIDEGMKEALQIARNKKPSEPDKAEPDSKTNGGAA